MDTIRIFISVFLCTIALPATLSAHTLPEGSAVHFHEGIGEHTHDSYESDPGQPLYSKLAECAAIYDSAVEKGPQLDDFLSNPHKEQLSGHAQKLKDKALVIARKKDLEDAKQSIAAIYDTVYKIWAERWYFIDDGVHYTLVTDNRIWLNYCKKLGTSLNILPQFSNDL